MTIRLSTGTRNGMANALGIQGMFNRGYMEIFSVRSPPRLMQLLRAPSSVL